MRAFVASFLGDANQTFYSELADNLIERHPTLLRRIPATSAHLTYAFVPTVPDGQVEHVLRQLADTARTHQTIAIALRRPRVLMGGRVPRIICADVHDGAGAL